MMPVTTDTMHPTISSFTPASGTTSTPEQQQLGSIESYLESHPEFILQWIEEKAPSELVQRLTDHQLQLRPNKNTSSTFQSSVVDLGEDVPNSNKRILNNNNIKDSHNNHNSSGSTRRHNRIPSATSTKSHATDTITISDTASGEANSSVGSTTREDCRNSICGSSSGNIPILTSTSPRPSATTLAGLTDEEIAALHCTKSKRNSITSDRFQSWLSSTATSPSKQRGSYCGDNIIMGGSSGGAAKTSTPSPSESLAAAGTGGVMSGVDTGGRNHSMSICSGSVDIPSRRQSTISESVVSRLEQLGENELFIELVKDISNELNIDILCHKILVNVGYLTQADRCSLFLARGPHEQRYLVAKLFDVTVDSVVEEALTRANFEEIRIPFGIGIAGHVAQTKEIVNIKDAYKDSRFNQEVDTQTGYKTTSILALPICNNEGDVIGVAQVINKKTGDQHFTSEDIEVFQRYLIFCGIGIQNAQLFETSVAEYRRNQLLLNLARSIFEEQTSLERLVSKIMKEAQELIKCERSLVYLRDVPLYEASQIEKILMMPSLPFSGDRKPLCRRESKTVSMRDVLKEKGVHFELVFELTCDDMENEVRRPSGAELQNSPLTQIAKYVATTSEILNIGDAITWYGESFSSPTSPISSSQDLVLAKSSEIYDILPKSILCMPIYNGQRQVIGVAQLINKVNNQPFTDSDANTFEAFAIFCGLGIHNTQLYEGACKLMAKQSVALECLSYHATASPEDTERLRRDEIGSAVYYKLHSYNFSDFSFTDSDTCKATIRMFLELNLVEIFHIPYAVLCRWILSIKKNYRPVKYHNWRHAFNVAQTMFTVLKTGKMEQFLDDRDILGLMVACLCHDLDHRGTNNAFQQLTASPLAVLYSTSTMEHHHFDQCVMILSSEGNNIFQDLSAENYRKVMKIVEKSILSTDLAMYFRKKDHFIELIENGEIAWQGEDKKDLLCGMMMTACDVAAIAKPWEIQHKIAKLVADEFFDQGDLEKEQLNQQPVAMMDREKKDELPKMQLSFIDVICLPLYKTLSDTFPWLKPLYTGCKINRQNWQDLAEKVDMGLTWIDHDVIEQPVEEFTRDTEPKDIDFVVTTLNCNAGADAEKAGENDATRRTRSKWKLRRLFQESSHIHKSTSSQLSKTSKDTPSTPPLLIKNDESAGSSPNRTPTANVYVPFTNNKSNASATPSRNLTPTKSQLSTKQSCRIC